MRAAVEAVGDEGGEAGAIKRFLGVGRAYVRFAVAEPHLFRHLFGPAGADGPPAEPPQLEKTIAGHHAEGDDPYAILLARIAELGDLGLLRPGIGEDQVFPVLAWSIVHGFSSLVIEGHLPVEAGKPVLALFGRTVLTDHAFAAMQAALAGAAS